MNLDINPLRNQKNNLLFSVKCHYNITKQIADYGISNKFFAEQVIRFTGFNFEKCTKIFYCYCLICMH